MKSFFLFLKKSAKDAVTQAVRNKFLTFSTLLFGALVVFLLNFVFGVQFFAKTSITDLEKRSDFLISVQQNYDPFTLDALRNEISEKKATVSFLPAEKYAEFSSTPFLQITFQDISKTPEVFAILEKSRYTDVIEPIDQKDQDAFLQITGQLLRLDAGMKKASFFLIILFVICGIAIFMNAFRLTIFSRKKEIFIARIVGADPSFIFGPFLFEGFFIGILSALFGMLAFVIALREINLLPGGEIFLYLWNSVFLWELLFSALVGILSAYLSVRSYIFKSST